jgi:hypothetical protein
MSELPSAMFSIADGNEFRFARFYIVCEAIRLEALESPLIVCACRTFPRWIVKAWQDTEWNVKCGTKEIHAFCSNEFPPPVLAGALMFLGLGFMCLHPVCSVWRFCALQVKELLVSGADVRRLDGIRHLAENAQQRLRA